MKNYKRNLLKSALSLLSLQISLLTSILLFSCSNPFDTRKAETPISGTNNFRNLSEQEDVLHNLINSFKEKKSKFYTEVFDSTLVFRPSETASTPFFENWTLTEEDNFANRFFSDGENLNSQLSLDTSNVEYQNFSTETAQIKFEYEISFEHFYDSQDSINTFRGYSEFSIERKNDIWQVVDWLDRPTFSEKETWTNLKFIVLNNEADR